MPMELCGHVEEEELELWEYSNSANRNFAEASILQWIYKGGIRGKSLNGCLLHLNHSTLFLLLAATFARHSHILHVLNSCLMSGLLYARRRSCCVAPALGSVPLFDLSDPSA